MRIYPNNLDRYIIRYYRNDRFDVEKIWAKTGKRELWYSIRSLDDLKYEDKYWYVDVNNYKNPRFLISQTKYEDYTK